MAYRQNFLISLMNSLLSLGAGVLALRILFHQVESLRGWDFAGTLALLGVYLTVASLRNLFIAPGLEALAGMGREIWNGEFDFSLLRPINTQFLVSFRTWRLFSLVDLAFGVTVLAVAVSQPGITITFGAALVFSATFFAGLVALYAVLLACSALVFWSPDLLFTWVFDGIFQLARFPVGLYPGWLRFLLTWIIPVGLMTTLPTQALTGDIKLPVALTGVIGSLALLAVASRLFRQGMRHYASASS